MLFLVAREKFKDERKKKKGGGGKVLKESNLSLLIINLTNLENGWSNCNNLIIQMMHIL